VWEVIGQSRVVSLLQRSLEADTLAHAYLLVGPPHVGKMTLALNLAQTMNCPAAERPCGECDSCRKIAASGHADVQVVGLAQNENSSETKLRTEISIDQIRQIQHSASLPPFEGDCRVFIIEPAEFLSHEAANSLLKTLEEPVGRVLFILLTTNDNLLPATVVSRCQRLELTPLAAAEIESVLISRWNVEPARARLLARLCHGCPGWAISAAADDSLLHQRDEEIDRLLNIIAADYEERFAHVARLASQFNQNRGLVYAVLDLWLDYWRDLLLVKLGCRDMITNVDRLAVLAEMAEGYSPLQIRDFIENILKAKEQLGQNANPRLVLEVMMLDMPGKERGSEEKLATRYR